MSTLKISKVEGLPYPISELSCSLHLNNTIQELISPLSSDHKVAIPPSGELKLLIQSLNDKNCVLAYCDLQLETLRPGNNAFDLTTEVLAEVNGKIFLELGNFEDFSQGSPESGGLCMSEDESEPPRLKLQLKMQALSLQEISLELQSTKQKLNNESKARQSVDEKLKETLKEYSQFVNMAQGREKSMLKLLEQKDVEIAENINQTLKLQGYLDRLLEDKRHVEEKLACLRTVAANDETELLRQQVLQLKTQLFQEDKRRQELQDMLLQIGKEWRETEDQEKINAENKIIRAEQENLRSNAVIQDLQIEVQRYKSAQDKCGIEIQLLKQELERVTSEKVVSDAEVLELKAKVLESKVRCEGLDESVRGYKGEMVEVYEEREKMKELIVSKDQQISVLEKNLQGLTLNLNEEKDLTEQLSGKLQQEKIYSDRLNDQIIQERISGEKFRKEASGPDLDTLIEDSFRSAKLENSLLKVGESFFFDGIELQLTRKIDFYVEVKVANAKEPPVPLTQFLLCPRNLNSNIRKRASQDSKVDSENEGFSVFSVDRDKSMFNTDKIEKKMEAKGKGTKLVSRPSFKLPLKDKNVRIASVSAERKRPFK